MNACWPPGLRGKHQFKHTVAYNEGRMPKPPDDFAAHTLLFATSPPSRPPQPNYLHLLFTTSDCNHNFCIVIISVFVCLALCCSFSVSLLSDAKLHLTLRQLYRREVLKKHLLCGGIDIKPLAWNKVHTYTLLLWSPPFYYLFFFFFWVCV